MAHMKQTSPGGKALRKQPATGATGERIPSAGQVRNLMVQAWYFGGSETLMLPEVWTSDLHVSFALFGRRNCLRLRNISVLTERTSWCFEGIGEAYGVGFIENTTSVFPKLWPEESQRAKPPLWRARLGILGRGDSSFSPTHAGKDFSSSSY